MSTALSPLAHRRGPLPGRLRGTKKMVKGTSFAVREKHAKRLIDATMEKAGHVTYRPSFAKVAKIVCAVFGCTESELASFFRVHPATIRQWIKTRAEFREAVTDGSVSANMTMMQRLYRQGCGFYYRGERVHFDTDTKTWHRTTVREYVKPSETAQIFWLKNRMPEKWKDKHELVGKDGERLAGDLYQLFNVTVSPDVAIDTYNKLLQVEARADIEFKKQKD